MTIVNEFTSAAVSDRGLNEGRPHNEDSFLELVQHGVFAVADGVGGAQAGEVASQMAVEILSEAFTNMEGNADPEEIMRLALDRANEAIFQMSHDLPQLSSMATTIAALHLNGDIATIAHVGDSRVYRMDGHGRLFRETEDHSVVEEEVRAGRMTPEQAATHPSRNVISRALGAEPTVEPDIKLVLVYPATRFLLCSDGITRHISDKEIEEMLLSNEEPRVICEQMKRICYERGAEDNLTAVIVSFPGERIPPAFDPSEDVTVPGIRAGEGSTGLTVENIDASVAESNAIPNGSVLELDDLTSEVSDPPEVARSLDDETYLMDTDSDARTQDTATIGDVPTDELPEPEEVTADPVHHSITEHREVVSYPEPRSSSSAFVVGGLLILALIAGFAGGYFLFKTLERPVETPVITEQKSNNVPLTSFEETRRLVDANPVKYLNANAATPQEAGDYFWLGRALMLTGKPIEAKRAFEEARRRLPEVAESSNVKTMENEIAMALSIIDDPRTFEAFSKSIAPPTAEDNGNANTGVVGTRPNR